MAREPLNVEVVSAEQVVWTGKSTQVIARTVEGDIGILPGHEPVLALLQPSRITIVTAEGTQESLYVDGGFLSVARNRVSILAEEAKMGEQISVEGAQAALDKLMLKYNEGEASDEERHQIHMLKAQLAAAAQASGNN